MSDLSGGRENTRLILASSSPRRDQLLTGLGLFFEIIPSQVDETIDFSLPPEKLVLELAEQKAQAVFDQVTADSLRDNARADLLVIGADTMVVMDGDFLGKPQDKPDARAMLSRLSGRWHEVFTGVVLFSAKFNGAQPGILRSCERSRVLFRQLDEREIFSYVETGEPMDKAGAYALQGIGSALVQGIEGSHTNIVGLPIPNVVQLLRQTGYQILGLP